VVVEQRRSRWIDVRRDDETGAGEGRPGRRERKDHYREKAAHLFRGYGEPLRPDRWRSSASALAAEADHGRMRNVGTEPVLTPKPLGERLEDAHRDLLFRSALSA